MAGMRIVGLGRDSENAGKEEEKVGTSHIGNIDDVHRVLRWLLVKLGRRARDEVRFNIVVKVASE